MVIKYFYEIISYIFEKIFLTTLKNVYLIRKNFVKCVAVVSQSDTTIWCDVVNINVFV